MKKRLYKSGSTWALFRWSIPDSGYITRLHLIKTPWFAICLHWLNKPDPEPYRHDHPVTFLSLILRGWYREDTVDVNTVSWYRKPDGKWRGQLGAFKRQTHRWFNFIRATPDKAHSIIAVAPRTLTLCFMGPKTREWGFHKPMPDGTMSWIPWKEYYAAQRKGVQL